MTDPLAGLRAAFPVAESWIYFNHAAVAPLSIPVRRALDEFADDAMRSGSVYFERWLQRREVAREKAARLIGATPAEIAFTTSTSQGLITVAEGLGFGPGDEIIVIQDDVPANHIPWFRQQRRHGARVVVVPRQAGRVPLEAIATHLGPRTRLVAVPSALFDQGFRLDLQGLGELLADHPALLCVDAIQTLGAFPIDVRASRIDFLSADSHKWMLGLEGIGLFYCRRDLVEQLDTPFVSWLSVESPFEPYRTDAPLHADARRFEFASMPQLEVFAIDACLELLLHTGVENMSARILELTDRLADGLADRGWRVATPRSVTAEKSGIVAATPPAHTPEQAVELLTERGVSVAERGGWVRFAPHAWNTTEEVDTLLERLP